MKVNCKEPIKSLSGLEIKEETGKTMTVGVVISNALLAAKGSKFNKAKLFSMAMKFYEDKNVEVTPEEIAEIKTILEDEHVFASALFAGRTIQYLESLK